MVVIAELNLWSFVGPGKSALAVVIDSGALWTGNRRKINQIRMIVRPAYVLKLMAKKNAISFEYKAILGISSTEISKNVFNKGLNKGWLT